MDTLLFTWHAETALAGRFCGNSDPPINESGQRPIESLLKALETEPIDAIYTHDLPRALVTAEAIGETRGHPPVAISQLRELNFGEWEGLSREEIESRDQEYARRWSGAYPEWPAPGGDNFEAFRFRVLTEVELFLAVPSQRLAAVVTHGGAMRIVLRSLCGADERKAWERTREYCSIFRYQLGRLV